MATQAPKPTAPRRAKTLQHDEARRKNIPTAEYQSVLEKQRPAPVRVCYPRAAERSREPGSGWAAQPA